MFIDKRKFNNMNAIEDVLESNKTEKHGDDFSREAQLLGGFVKIVHRRHIEDDPKEQRKQAYKIRQKLKFI